MEIRDVIILRALPGSGKSTLANVLAGGNKDIICETDEFMVNKDGEYDFNPRRLGYCHNQCMEKFKDLIHKSEPLVIVSNTSCRNREIKPYKEYAKENGYRVHTVIVENRHGEVSVHDVPEETITKMRERFQIQL